MQNQRVESAVVIEDKKMPEAIQDPMWKSVFEQFKVELESSISKERVSAVDTNTQSLQKYRDALAFLSSMLRGITPEMAAELRHPSAEKSLIFVCSTWTKEDRLWIDTFAVFDHRTYDDMKIVWIPGSRDLNKLKLMYQKLQQLGCSDNLKSVMRKHGPDTRGRSGGNYIWFWNGD